MKWVLQKNAVANILLQEGKETNYLLRTLKAKENNVLYVIIYAKQRYNTWNVIATWNNASNLTLTLEIPQDKVLENWRRFLFIFKEIFSRTVQIQSSIYVVITTATLLFRQKVIASWLLDLGPEDYKIWRFQDSLKAANPDKRLVVFLMHLILVFHIVKE